MTFSLNDEEQNGVSIAVNQILKLAYRVEDDEDWSATANEWWNKTRGNGQTAREMLADDPETVVIGAVQTLLAQQAAPSVSIYVLPTEEDLPPRAVFLVDAGDNVKAPIGGAEYVDGAWRYSDGSEVPNELAEAITAHAESLGVEWDH